MRNFPHFILFAILSLNLKTELLPTANASGDLPHLDVSGSDGQDGANGYSHMGRAPRGLPGAPGGHAGYSTEGQPAGDIDITLQSGSSADTFNLNGNLFLPSGKIQPIQSSHPVRSSGFIELQARGGNGGSGGHGGDGEGGGEGYPGHDANRYHNGGDGGPGFAGGDGGEATSGSEGGEGGQINIRVHEKDMHLFKLVSTPTVSGGTGGSAGRNGQGGDGGPGGPGGNSFRWSETRTRDVPYQHVDKDGHTHTRVRKETYTVWHSNSGGFRGPKGSDGRPGNAYVTAGKNGNNGRYTYIVHSNEGTTHYSQIYDLELVRFRYQSDNDDGINEPGEKIYVDQIQVRNSGGMPTPPYQEIEISLKSSRWTTPSGQKIRIPVSLAPGEEYILKDDLKFTIPDYQVDREGDAFHATGTVDLAAELTVVSRGFSSFQLPQNFEVRYPIKVTPVAGINTMTPGSVSRILWKLENISNRDFGSESDIRRDIAVHFSWKSGDISPEQLSYISSDGSSQTLETTLIQAMSHLKAHQSVLIEGNLKLSENILTGSKANLNLSLLLGRIQDPHALQAIQFRDFSISAARYYHKTPGSGILLITNRNSSKEEVLAWQNLGSRLRTSIDIWDLSLYGYLDLIEKLTGGDASLVENFKGKTIVILDNNFDLSQSLEGQGLKSRGFDYLSKDHFVKAIQDYEVHFYVLGPKAPDFVKNLIPTEDQSTQQHENWKKFAQSESPDSPPATGLVHEIPVPASGCLCAPSPSTYLVRQANKVLAHLQDQHPDRCYFYQCDVDTSNPALYGTLRVRRSLNLNQLGLFSLQTEINQLHSPDFVLGKENTFALITSLPFHEKLTLFKSFLDQIKSGASADQDEIYELLKQAILTDLIYEQRLLLNNGRNHGLREAQILSMLPKLKLFSSSFPQETAIESKSSVAREAIDLLAKIKVMIDSEVSWINKIFPFRRSSWVNSVSINLWKTAFTQFFPVQETSSHLFRSKSEPSYQNNQEAKKELKTAYSAVYQNWKQAQKTYNARVPSNEKLHFNDYLALVFMNPQTQIPGYQRSDQKPKSGFLIMNSQSFQNELKEYKNRKAYRAKLKEEHDRARNELLVSVPWEEVINPPAGTEPAATLVAPPEPIEETSETKPFVDSQ